MTGIMCSGQWSEAVRGSTCVPHPTTETSVYRCSWGGGGGGRKRDRDPLREQFDLAPLAGGLLKPFAQWDVEIPGVMCLRSVISEEALKLTLVKAAQRHQWSKGLHLAQK